MRSTPHYARRAPAALGAVAVAALACAGLGRVPFESADCQCVVEALLIWDEATLSGDPGLELSVVGEEMYLTVRLFAKAEIDGTNNMLYLLETWQRGDRIEPPEASPVASNPVVFEPLDGFPSVRRMCWRTVDDLTVSMWTVVVDMPDAYWVVEAWTLLELEASHLPGVMEVVQTLRRTTPDPGPMAEPFMGAGPPRQEPVPPSEAREGAAAPPEAPEGAPPPEPAPPLERIRFPAAVGDLWAYGSPAPTDDVRRPAVLFAHAGFDGLNASLTDTTDPLRGLSLQPYLDQGLVVLAPSWRGEHDNPGDAGWLWDEVQDVLAARAYLASLPHVDPDRIDLVGLGYGGSLALLAAAEPDAGFRSVTTLGATLDLEVAVRERPDDWSAAPFDSRDLRALALRSPVRFARHLATPTLLIVGEHASNTVEGEQLEAAARAHGAGPVHAVRIPHADGVAFAGVAQTWLASRLASTVDRWPRPPTDQELVDLGQRTWDLRRAELAPRMEADLRARLRAGFDADDAVRAGSEARWLDEAQPAPLVARMIDDALPRLLAAHAEEEATWPARTDVDRLLAALARLEPDGIVQRHHVGGDSDTAFNTVDREATRDGARGYVYTLQGAVLRAADDGPLLLSYGVSGPTWQPDDVKALGEQVVSNLEAEGLKTTWNGTPEQQIEVAMAWRKRGRPTGAEPPEPPPP